jgi:hypothetical protein
VNVVRLILRLIGSKLNKGSAARFRIFLTVFPLFGFFLFFTEALQVLGFNGDVCFCKFKDTYDEFWGNYLGYDCMVNLKNHYQIIIYIKLIYISINLFFFMVKFMSYKIKIDKTRG